MPAAQGKSGFMNFYIWLCGFLNFWIIKLKLPVHLISSPKKKRDSINKIGDASDNEKKCNIRCRVMKAINLPAKDSGKGENGVKGSCDAYLKVKLGSKSFQSKPVEQTLNPDFNLEYVFESRSDSTGEIFFELWDWDRDAHDFIGIVKVKISKIITEKKIEKNFEVFDRQGMPVKCDTTRKPTKLRLQLSWDTDGAAGESEWLNGILRNGYRCFAPDVDAMVRAQLTAAFNGLKLPVVTLKLESFSIGNEAPFFNELRLLPTRSNRDIQLRAHLRWVSSGDFGIKIRAQTKLGVGMTVQVNNLEIDFPVWIQAHLQPDLEKPCTKFQMAATSDPKIRFGLAMGAFSTSTFPGIEEGIDFAIRKALKTVLVLPKKISVPLVPDAQLDPEKHYSAMEKTAVARLSVKILEAEDVEKKQMMDKLNPYITVASSNGKLESQKRQTKAVDATGDNNCEWNEFFDFLVTDELHEEITFQLMDVGKVSDDKCGKFVLHINELAQLADSGAGWQERWYPLTDCASGRIKLAVEYARFVDDNGPTQIDRAKKKAEPKNTAPPKWVFGQIVLQIKEAKGMPKTVFGGKPRCWCSIEYKSHAGVIKCRTPEVFDDCNPEWNEDLVMREKIDVDISKQEDKYITVVINDSSESRTGALGSVTLKLKEIVAKPGVHTLPVKDKNGKEIAKDATITISATFETIENSPEAAVGSDWLNGIIRKVWHVLTDKIEDKVKDVAGPILHKVRYPDPNPETGEEQSCATFLKIYKDILFETFELGQEPPSFFEMKMLNSRSEQDIQLIISLRWVASDNFSFKVRCQGNTGVPDFSVEIKGLELWLPLFVQVRLAGGGTGLGADVFEVAAMEDPVIKLQLKTEAGLLPGGINVDTIMGLVRSKIRNALVLPNRIRVCLAQDPVQKKVMAADKIGKKGAQDWPRDTRTHNGLAGCICDVGVKEGQVNNGKTVATTVNPDCPVKPGEYVCAVDSKGVPLYESVYDFKVARLRLDDRQKRAVGRLEIKLIEADDLHDPDAWGTVDAFCEVQIVGTGQKKISSTVSNDTAPVWSEMMDFLIVDEMNEVLKFEIFDRDMFKNDFLGEVEIPLSSLVSKSGWRDAWMPLQKNSGGGELHVGLCYRKLDPNDGPVASGTFVDDAGADVTSRALEEEEEESPFKGKLMVTVSKAENLQKMNTFSMTECDPYVMVDFGKNNKKTKTQKGLNPLFNQTFGFDCKTGGSMVVVALYDEETTSKDKMIGKKIFKLEDLVERPGKKWSEAFMLIGEDRQECRDGSGRTSLLYLTIQYVEEGQGLPAEPPAMTGGAGDVVSRDVLDEVSAGPPQASLFVKVIKANDLQKMDWTGAADPYVTITLSGEGKDKTRVMDKNLDPVFEEDFHWQMDKDSTKVLQLTIKDDNKVGTNTFMGIVEIPAQDVRTAKSISNKAYPVVDKKQQPVKGKSGKMATLTLNLDWKE